MADQLENSIPILERFRLDNRVALVTGGGQGICRAFAHALGEAGAMVAVVDMVADRAETVANELATKGVEVMAVTADITKADQVKRMVRTILDCWGILTISVNNAGIARDNLLVRLDPADWDAVLRTDLTGVYNCTKAVLRSMLQRRSGRVVTISSVVGLLGNSGQTAYGAAKAGVFGFTKSLAREIASRNITVNAVAPGYISTDMTAELSEEATEKLQQGIPLGRLGVGADVAGAVRFLLSEDAAYITGQILSVDGGMYM